MDFFRLLRLCARAECKEPSAKRKSKNLLVHCCRFTPRASPNDPVSSLEHVDRNSQTNLFCRLEVDDELELRCLLHRQISRLGTFQDLVHVNSRAAIELSGVRPVGHETTLIDKPLLWVNSREPVF